MAERELAELRSCLELETAERRYMAERLEDCEGRVAGLARQLDEARHERDEFRRQLQESTERQAELVRKLCEQQELNLSLQEDLVKAHALQQHMGPQALDFGGQAPHAELGLAAIVAAGSLEVPEMPANLEAQVNQLRRQVQDMVRAMQHGGPTGPETPVAALEEQLEEERAALAGPLLSPSALLMLDADPPKQVPPWALAAALPQCPGTECSTATEEELPTTREERLVGEWSSTTLQASELRRTSSADDLEELCELDDAAAVAAAAPAERLPSARGPKARARPARVVEAGDDLHESPPTRRAAREDPLSPMPTLSGGGMDGTHRAGGLSLRDLSEIKALKKPPPPIRMLMEVCCLLFHIQPVRLPDEKSKEGRLRVDYWEPARRYLLSDPFFLSKLRLYDDHVTPAQRAKIRKYFRDPEFTAERVRNCSKAAHELYGWVSLLMQDPPAAAAAQGSRTPTP